ncbi:hypothetical protein N7488_005330 [Penicillium malachiteum]|nr:hypothetical protein N7488_005330 [Penicillium malachiteum]
MWTLVPRSLCPAPRQGAPGTGEAPGNWAHFIRTQEFSPTRGARRFESDLLTWLAEQVSVREPILRYQFNYTGTSFSRMLTRHIGNFEAVNMQMVGQPSDYHCDPCLAHHGPFTTCIRVPGCPYISCRANCHWWERDARCITNPMRPAPLPPLPSPLLPCIVPNNPGAGGGSGGFYPGGGYPGGFPGGFPDTDSGGIGGSHSRPSSGSGPTRVTEIQDVHPIAEEVHLPLPVLHPPSLQSAMSWLAGLRNYYRFINDSQDDGEEEEGQ